MNRDDVIRMARVASLTEGCYALVTNEELECFAALVAAAEREACAMACEALAKMAATPESAASWMRLDCAAAIRARSAV